MKIFLPTWLVVRAGAVWMALVALMAPTLHGQIVINEVMADNGVIQNAGIFPDWVELYNPTPNNVDISDWSISDSNTPREYVFPTGTIIPSNGYLVVWCDSLTNIALHTGFSLGDKADDVTLFGSIAMGGGSQDSIAFGWQIRDLTIGRVPDGAASSFTLTTPTPGAPNQAVPLGVQDNLKINEIMADPAGGDDWFEMYNPETNYVQFGGLVWSDRVTVPTTNRFIPNLSFIAPGGFRQFFADNLQNRDADQTDFRLSSGGEAVALFRANRTNIIDSIVFGAQTQGASYGRLPDGGTNLVFFSAGRSTPAASNFQLLTDIIINEVLTHTDPPLEDAIELYNPTATNVNIGGWWLSNSRDDPKKFRIPTNTVVVAGGYRVFYEHPGSVNGFNSNGFGTNRSFTLNSARGDQIYLHTADAAGELTFFRASRDFGPAANAVSFGRYVTSDGKQELTAMSFHSFGVTNPSSPTDFRSGAGTTNPYPKVGPLVINEIMYHPQDIDVMGTNRNNDVDEYIEVHNPGAANVLLYDPVHYGFADGRTNTWRLRGVVDFNFPTNVALGPGGYLLVVNFNPATNTAQLDAFRSKYAVPTNVQIFGSYSSELRNSGGTIELLKPDPPQDPDLHPEDAGLVPYVRVEKIEYDDEGLWPMEPDGGGRALQRVHALGYGNDPTNWVAVTGSPGAQFIPNTAPSIDFIPDLTTNELRRIMFFITASDTNVPAQGLTFSLEPGAPTNATITPGGQFRWRASEHQGPGDYTVTVKVTDNGAPPMSSTRSFNIHINELNSRPSFYIRERWVKAGETLLFFSGHDDDFPPQLVTYTALNPPAGLTVDSNSGLVTWTPTEDQASTNAYYVTVEAFDDGEPFLTNRFAHTIHVLSSNAVLIVADVSTVGDRVFIEWQSVAGKTYQVQFTDSMTPPNWQPLTDLLDGTGQRMSETDRILQLQRFYRIFRFETDPP